LLVQGYRGCLLFGVVDVVDQGSVSMEQNGSANEIDEGLYSRQL